MPVLQKLFLENSFSAPSIPSYLPCLSVHRPLKLMVQPRHTKQWLCTAKSHGLQKFEAFDKFLLHIKDDHKKSYNDSQVSLLAERGVQSKRQLFEVCPLCGVTEGYDGVTRSDLTEHIVGHLRLLALKSLPPRYSHNEHVVPLEEGNLLETRSKRNFFERETDSQIVSSRSREVPRPEPTRPLSSGVENWGRRSGSSKFDPYEAKIKELYAKHTLKTVREIMLREEGFDKS
jgi:hypothetical protein